MHSCRPDSTTLKAEDDLKNRFRLKQIYDDLAKAIEEERLARTGGLSLDEYPMSVILNISCRTKLCACDLLRNLPNMVVFKS